MSGISFNSGGSGEQSTPMSDNLTAVSTGIEAIEIQDVDKTGYCAICLDVHEEAMRIQVACQHVFGKECIENWLKINNACPSCRQGLSEENPTVFSNNIRNTLSLSVESNLADHFLEEHSDMGEFSPGAFGEYAQTELSSEARTAMLQMAINLGSDMLFEECFMS